MNWSELLLSQIQGNYHAAATLMRRVEDAQLNWKPDSGSNWMSMGQLLYHITESCGMCCECFVTGNWKMPDGSDLNEVPAESMLPPADGMPAVESVAQALELLENDRNTAIKMVETAGEERLSTELVGAPWAPEMKMPLGQQLLQMVDHLGTHRTQLFYYLKLQGQPVNTMDLYGMVAPK